ncbi:DUF2474 family protein [Ruegeria sp. HKCCD6228]|nr:DUF2474 family protein [Ruegeria sp. HKCCD6228]
MKLQKQVFWFGTIWFGSVLCLATVAYVIRLLIA